MRILNVIAIVAALLTGCSDDSPLQATYGVLVATPSSFSFGETFVGATTDMTIDLRNEGTYDVAYAVRDLDDSPYALVSSSEGVLAPSSTTPLVIRFAPETLGEHIAEIVITSDAENVPRLELEARGVAVDAIDCDDDKPCTDDIFDPNAGTCSHAPREGSCVSDNACLVNTMCVDGVCMGEQRSCSPSVDCMEAYCEPQTGCVERPLPLACDDGDPCTDNVCVSTTGCTYPESTDYTVCGDEIACVSVPLCQGGVCTPFPIPDGASCNDGDFCTVDSCSAGVCVGTYMPGEPEIAEERPFVLPINSRRGAVQLASGRGLFFSESPYIWEFVNELNENDDQKAVFSVVSFAEDIPDLLKRTPTEIDTSNLQLAPMNADRAAAYSSSEDGSDFMLLNVDDAGGVAIVDQVADFHPRLVIGATNSVVFVCETRFALATVSIHDGAATVIDSQESACDDAHWARDTERLVTLEGAYDVSSGIPELLAERPASFDTHLWPFATHETVGFVSREKAFIYRDALAGYETFTFNQRVHTSSHGPDNPLVFFDDRIGRLEVDDGPAQLTDLGPLVLGEVGTTPLEWEFYPEQSFGGFALDDEWAVSPTGNTGYVGLGWTGSLFNVDDELYSAGQGGLSQIELMDDERLRTAWGPRPTHYFSTLELVRQGASVRAAQHFVKTFPAMGPVTLDVYVYAHDDGELESLTPRELEGSVGSPTDLQQLSPAVFASARRLYVVGFPTTARTDMTLFVYALEDLATGGNEAVPPLYSVPLEVWPYAPSAVSIDMAFSGTGRAWINISDFSARGRLFLIDLAAEDVPPLVLAQGSIDSGFDEMVSGHDSVVLDEDYDDNPTMVTYDGTLTLSPSVALNTPAGAPLLFNDETLLIGTDTAVVFASNLGTGNPTLSELELQQAPSYPRSAVGVEGRLVVSTNPALYTIYPPCPPIP